MMSASPDTEGPMADEIAGLAAAIAAAEARAAAGGTVDLASLTILLDNLTARTAAAGVESRTAARDALLALLEGATSLVDTLDRQATALRGQMHGLRRGRTAGRAYRTSAQLRQ
jgi:hypothetical protein